MDTAKQLELALQEIGRQAIRISQLEGELATFTVAGFTTQSSPSKAFKKRKIESGSHAEATIGVPASERETELQTRCETLEFENAQLAAALDKRTKLFEQAKQQYKQAKDYCKRWKEYYDTQRSCHASTTTPDPGASSAQSKGMIIKSETTPRQGQPAPVSSQATESEPDEPTPIKGPDDDDDDVPVVVTARPVKRRRDAGGQRTSPTAAKIKREPLSPMQPIELSSMGSADAEPLDSTIAEPQTSDLDNDQPAPRIKRESVKDNTVNLVNRKEGHTPRAALQPISNNLPTGSRLMSQRGIEGELDRKRYRKITQVAEDGDSTTQSLQMTPTAIPDDLAPIKIERRDRLATLLAHSREGSLETPAPIRAQLKTQALLTPRSATPAEAPAQSESLRRRRISKTSRKQLETPCSRRLHHMRASDDERTSHRDHEQEYLSETPLRSRPLEALRLDDFRINPAFAHSDFAFTDTVRGRDARRCLPGCTRPECCGEVFQRAIALGGLGDMNRDGTKDLGDNALLLEEYLGPEWSGVMDGLDDAQKAEMIVQAQARAFANRFGKHRQAFARRRTPPGFWRTDMPSTQELADDRVQAREMEREQVQERWTEALRPDGRWSFRDETSLSRSPRP